MKKKYLRWGYGIIICGIIAILISITVTSVLSMKQLRDRMSDPQTRLAFYDTAAKVEKDANIKMPKFKVQQYKASTFNDNGVFRDTIIVYFYEGIPDKTYSSFKASAQSIFENQDTAKSVTIDSLEYIYEDRYLRGFRSYLSVRIKRDSPYGEIIYGNW